MMESKNDAGPPAPAPEATASGSPPRDRMSRLLPRLPVLGALLLYLALALVMTRPWIFHPTTTAIGIYDHAHGIESSDTMANATFAGWIPFSIFELGISPLARSEYLLYPAGGSYGDSYDSLLMAFQTAFLSLFMPLLAANSVTIVLCYVLCGFATFLLLWRFSSFGIALGLGMVAECSPWVFHRSTGHVNLLPIWVFPFVMMVFDLCVTEGRRRHWAALGLCLPLLAMASWYFLIMGAVFLTCAGFVHAVAEIRAGRSRELARPLLAAAAGGAAVLALALPMLMRRAETPPELDFLVRNSAPLVQYLLPYPGSYAAQLFAPAREWQSRTGTTWEAYVGVPLPILLLFVALCVTRGWNRRKATVVLAGVAAFVYSLGPELHVARVGDPGEGVPLPLALVLRLLPFLHSFRVPARMHLLFFFIALAAAALVLEALRTGLAARANSDRGADRFAARFAGPAALVLLVSFSISLMVPLGPSSLMPVPRVPEFMRKLGERPGRGAIMDVPIDFYLCPRYNYYQFAHKRPCVSSTLFHGAHSERVRAFLYASPARVFFFASDQSWCTPETVAEIVAPPFMADLASTGIEYLVVHAQFERYFHATGVAHSKKAEYMSEIEEAWAERLVYRDDLVRVYRTGASDVSSGSPEALPAGPGGFDPAALRLDYRDLTLPSAMTPGSEHRATVILRNAGTTSLPESDDLMLGYRWVAPEGRTAPDLAESAFATIPPGLAPGQACMFEITIHAPDEPDPRWLLHVAPVRRRTAADPSNPHWLDSSDSSTEFPIAITEGGEAAAPSNAVARPAPPPTLSPENFERELRWTFISVELPETFVAGSPSRVRCVVRNDGDLALPEADLALGYHWSDPEGTGSWEAVVWDDGRHAELDRIVPPGGRHVFEWEVMAPSNTGEAVILSISPRLRTAESAVWGSPAQSHTVRVRVTP